MNKETIEIINFNEPQNIESLKIMLNNGHFPAFFRFEMPSTDLLVEHGNQYARFANDNNKTLWLLLPKNPIEPKFAVLPGKKELSNIVSTETGSKLTSDITLIFYDHSRINLNEFQLRVQLETLNYGVERQR